MKVLKFGGTSVANAKNITQVLQIVKDYSDDNIVVVVSALGGVTDLLIKALTLAASQDKGYEGILSTIETKHLDLIKELIPPKSQSTVLGEVKARFNTLETLLEGAYLIGEYTASLSDRVVGHGELLSSFIINEFFKAEGLDTTLKNGKELIITDDSFGKAAVDFSTTNTNCKNYFTKNSQKITLVPGFVASSHAGKSTTLGRGGSDYTAAIIAAAIEAEVLEIWTDVSGMYTANPKLVKQAKCVEHLSYEEAMELSHFGAKVLYPPTIQPVLNQGIPIIIKNTFAPKDVGTLISQLNNGKDKTVRGISHIGDISLLSLEGPGMVGTPGISKRFFETLSQADISIVMITQASSEHSICIAVADSDAKKAEDIINTVFAYEIEVKKIKPVSVEKKLAIIALVGDNMKSHQGLSGKMFSALGKNNVNVRAIAQGASERNISAVIDKADVKKALNTLHEEFFEENIKQLNLFVMGVGNVGSKFLQQIAKQRKFLKNELKLNLRVIGISNSRTMYFNENGIALGDWEKLLSEGEKANKDTFVERVNKLNYRNSIFVDNTASQNIAETYSSFLENSISVVTCNKIACSSRFDYYSDLKHLAKKFNAPFLFETNVGAGLPIIDTLKNLRASGDKILKIQAVLSGSLNFVFNSFNENISFYEVVKKAQEEGYTEPDPRIDLSGIDVMRKILILARESGNILEIEDIKNNSFLPKESENAKTVSAFLDSLKDNETHFQDLYAAAKANNSKLKYVAQFEKGKASVGLQQIAKGHDFYNLEGSDNIVLFYTERYPNLPMIIKGAGAGAAVTASGIFADIIRIGNF
ncbi:MAG: bifunctional aspartate kinase/homoserine dehydrogenase I [Allomuricauda sp.]|nr:MAG: bifunctional aspartate kinase/homoserine dehydrogenase I [Allomuricauda sp.]